jgi:hypothetical protein
LVQVARAAPDQGVEYDNCEALHFGFLVVDATTHCVQQRRHVFAALGPEVDELCDLLGIRLEQQLGGGLLDVLGEGATTDAAHFVLHTLHEGELRHCE